MSKRQSLSEVQRTGVRELVRAAPVVSEVGRRFTAAGHQIALVGGSVRDALLGRLGTDLDFATSARPDEIDRVLDDWVDARWDMGREFGTIGARVDEWTLELTTYRFRGHSMADPGTYRSRAEVESFKQAGPLERIEQAMAASPDRAGGSAVLDKATMQRLRDEVEQTVEDAVAFAEASPAPTLADAWDALHANRRLETLIQAEPGGG